jgi:hypothetical protein
MSTMRKASIAGGAFVIALGFLAVVVPDPAVQQEVERASATAPAIATSTSAAAQPAIEQPGFLYGRIIVADGVTYEGRLRWGGDQEAFWGDYFDGAKQENPWVAHAPVKPLPKERNRIEIFGFEVGGQDRSINLRRLFMARFGDIARVQADFRQVHVTLKSGTVFALDRFAAGDIDDGVRVWDGRRGVLNLDARAIRAIEFLPTAPLVAAAGRLHGTVRTREGDFTGFIQWNRQDCVGDDELEGRAADGEIRLRYDTIRSIARQSRDSVLVSLFDGRELVLSNSREVGRGNRGIYVDDRRFGRVLISWDAFERVDFSSGGSGPGYGDFPPGRSLAGNVTTRDGRRLTGRLIYDFDESETTETFDAAFGGVDYTIPFGLITSIVLARGEEPGAQRARVILRDGLELQLERSGDLGESNAGMLVFVDGPDHAEYVPWADVEQIDFDRSPAMYPPPGDR